MIGATLTAWAFSILTVVEHVQILPTVSESMTVGCCVAYVEPTKMTVLDLKISETEERLSANLSVKYKF